jgi:replicative DNA helicase
MRAQEIAGYETDKIYPHDIEAEQAVLGVMMVSENALLEAAELVAAKDFYNESNVLIFSEMIALNLAGKPVTPIIVKDALTKSGMLEKAGGAAYLHMLYSQAAAPAATSHYAEIVANRSYLRQLMQTLLESSQVAQEIPDDPRALSQRVQGILYELDNSRADKKEQTLIEQMKATFEEIEAAHEGKRGGLDVGITSVDTTLTGMYPGDLVVLAARPAMGKSALALSIAHYNAARGIPVFLSSLEMIATQLLKRLYCQVAMVDSHRMANGTLQDSEWDKLGKATAKIAELPLKISDKPASTVIDVKSQAREFFRKHKKPGLIIIDYLQLITPVVHRENTVADLTEISRSLKNIAGELKCPLIALSQLSRANEYRSNKLPQLSDLRGSGSIEQDADIVAFIHRELDAEDEEKRSQAKIYIAKHRSGPIGVADVYYNEHYTCFYEIDNRYDKWSGRG